MATLEPRLTEISRASSTPTTPQSTRERLLHLSVFGSAEFMDIDWGERPDVSRDDVDDLAHYGFVDIDYSPKQGNYLVTPTPEGRSAIERLRRERGLASRSETIDLSWATVRPVQSWTSGSKRSPTTSSSSSTAAQRALVDAEFTPPAP